MIRSAPYDNNMVEVISTIIMRLTWLKVLYEKIIQSTIAMDQSTLYNDIIVDITLNAL